MEICKPLISKTYTILFVSDQKKSTAFYKFLLNMEPQLFVPGMTEFSLSDNCVLGLMPISGIKKILNGKLFGSEDSSINPKSELYLFTDDAADYLKRAASLGAIELSPVQERSWGHRAAYFIDPDYHIIAIAEEL
jgi:catechol 2,3-dioxygenase-like lactoylglutathione lyase family enzyme